MRSLITSEPLAPRVSDDGLSLPGILIEGVSGLYRVLRERITSFGEYALRTLQRCVVHEELWAVRDVSVDVQRGELFGLIGRNRAGKSTLPRVGHSARATTRGRVRVWGSWPLLLGLGAQGRGLVMATDV